MKSSCLKYNVITQKHLTTEDPTSANSNWQNSQSIFNTSWPSKKPTTSRSYEAKTKRVNFTGKSVRLNEETLHFKREQTREIVHASCLNVNGSNNVICSLIRSDYISVNVLVTYVMECSLYISSSTKRMNNQYELLSYSDF